MQLETRKQRSTDQMVAIILKGAIFVFVFGERGWLRSGEFRDNGAP